MAPLCIDLFCGLGGFSGSALSAGYRAVGFDIKRHAYFLPVNGGDGTKQPGAQDLKLPGKAWNDENQKRMNRDIRKHGGAIQKYPAQLVLQDILTVHGSQFRDAAFIWASPPCQQYSWLAMPWSRSTDPENSKAAKALRNKWETEGPDNRLFDACFRIQREAIEATICTFCGHDKSDHSTHASACVHFRGRYIPMIVENVRGAQEWVGRAKANYGSFYLWGDVGMVGNRIVIQHAGRTHMLRVPGKVVKLGGGRSWSDFGKPGYVPFGFNTENEKLMAGVYREGVKVASDEGRRTDVGKGARFTSRDCGVEAAGDGTKIGGDWFSDPNSTCRKHGSRSSAREAASAMIAKIPAPLARFVAESYYPVDQKAMRA